MHLLHHNAMALLPGRMTAGELYREKCKSLFTAACVAPEPEGNALGDHVGVEVEIGGTETELQGSADPLLWSRVADVMVES